MSGLLDHSTTNGYVNVQGFVKQKFTDRASDKLYFRKGNFSILWEYDMKFTVLVDGGALADHRCHQ